MLEIGRVLIPDYPFCISRTDPTKYLHQSLFQSFMIIENCSIIPSFYSAVRLHRNNWIFRISHTNINDFVIGSLESTIDMKLIILTGIMQSRRRYSWRRTQNMQSMKRFKKSRFVGRMFVKRSDNCPDKQLKNEESDGLSKSLLFHSVQFRFRIQDSIGIWMTALTTSGTNWLISILCQGWTEVTTGN
jgi:hypothetical protein